MRFLCGMFDTCNRMSRTFVRFRRILKFIWTVSNMTMRVKFENKTENVNDKNINKNNKARLKK